MPPTHLWLNGEIVPWSSATLHVTDARSLTTVSSVYEGIRGYWNAEQRQLYVFRLPEHMRRFAGSMKVMRMQPAYTPADLVAATVELLRHLDLHEDTYIRPVATFLPRDDSWSGPDPTHLEIQIATASRPSSLGQERKLNVGISSWRRIEDNSMPPRVKANANYLSSRLVSAQAALDGYDGAIILNSDGSVAEGPWACVFAARDGRLITPSVTSNILESITRQTVIQVAREVLGVEVQERAVDRTELYLADELFFCGTGQELQPIVSVDRYTVGDGDVGPLTARLRGLYRDIVHGREPRYEEWLTPVY